MPNASVGALSASSVVLALLGATAAPVPARGAGAACTRARINGASVCLSVGERCRARYQTQYAKYGFSCGSGRLAKTKARKTIPPTATPGTTTTSPAGPFAGTWYAADPTDGSLEQVTFGTDGSLMFRDDAATTCGGVWAYATATGAAKGNVWTASAPTTLLCPDNAGSVGNHLFQFTLNANGTLTATGTPDVWTRDRPG